MTILHARIRPLVLYAEPSKINGLHRTRPLATVDVEGRFTMRYKNEKLLQVRRKAAELDIGLSIALQKILLDVFQSDEKIAEDQFSRGWSCGYEKGFEDGRTEGQEVSK